MAVTRINNNQISDASSGNAAAGINAATKLQDYSITAGKLGNDITYGSNLTITGNLQVQGNTTQIDTDIITVEDPLLLLASNQTGAPALDIGFIGQRGAGTNIAFVWEESANAFVTAFTTTSESNTTITLDSYADFKTHNANVTNNLEVVGTTSLVGNIISDANVSGNVNSGNVNTVGIVSALGNVVTSDTLNAQSLSLSGNVISTLNVTGNVVANNVNTTTDVVAGANVVATTSLNAQNLSLTGNVTSELNITGNVTANNVNSVTDVVAGANVVATTSLNAQNLSLTGNVTSELSVTSNVVANNINTVNAVSATGNIVTSTFFVGDGAYISNISGANVSATKISNGTSSMDVATLNGNIDVTIGGASTGTFYSGGFTSAGNIDATTGTLNAQSLSLFGNVISPLNVTGNVLAGNVNAVENIRTTGNVVAANFVSTTLTQNQFIFPNIDGNLVSTSNIVTNGSNITLNSGDLSVVGNVSLSGTDANLSTTGNIAATGQISATGNVYGNNISITNDASVGANLTVTANVIANTITGTNLALWSSAGGLDIQLTTGNINVNSTYINNLLDPVASGDAANKGYVDAIASGLDLKASCDVGTVQPLDTETEVTNVVYNNGTAGVGATLTITTSSQLIIDGVDLSSLPALARVLIKDELVSATPTSDAAWNGIYVVTSTGAGSTVLTRSTDFDDEGTLGSIPGAFTFVTAGTGQAGTGWVCITQNPITMGTTAIQFAQFANAGQYQAGNGIAINGTVITTKYDNSTIGINGSNELYIPANAPLVTPNIGNATGSSLSVTGNVTGNNVVATTDLSAVGNVVAAALNAANLSLTGNVISTLNVTGNVVANNVNTVNDVVSGANVVATTSVNSVSLSLSGNVISPLNITGNVTANNVNTVTDVVAGANVVATTSVNSVSLSLSGNVISAINTAFDVTAANVSTTGNVVSAGNVDAAAGAVNAQSLSLSGNVTSALNVTGNATAGNVTAVGNVDAGNINITSSGNISGANVISGTTLSATTDVNSGGNVSATGNIVAAYLWGDGSNITGLSATAANIINGTSNVDIKTANGNVTFGVAGVDNVLIVSDTVTTAAGNISAVGNVLANNSTITNNLSANNVTGTTSGTFGNITIIGPAIESNFGAIIVNGAGADNDFRVDGTAANVFYVDAGTNTVSIGSNVQTTDAILSLNATTSFVVPVGNTAQRPATGVTGMQRFNTSTGYLEMYDGANWTVVGGEPTVITDQQFNGDGVTTAFTLSSTQTTNSCIVSINGVVQVPTTAYSVVGTTLTFTEAPAVGDHIDVREIATTTTVTGISNSSGNATIEVTDAAANVNVTGNLVVAAGGFLYGDGTYLTNVGGGNVTATKIVNGTSQANFSGAGGSFYVSVAGGNVINTTTTETTVAGDFNPSANVTYSLGNSTNRWSALYVAGNTIYIGDGTITSNASGVTLTNSNGASFTVSGNTAGDGNVTGGNLIGTTSVFSNGLIQGANLSALGNVVASANVNATNINSSGTISAASDITAGQFLGNVVSVVGNITGSTLNIGSIVNTGSNGSGNIGSASNYFNTVFAMATSAQYADLAEKYVADAEYAPGTVVSFGGEAEVTASSANGDRRVAGVVSTNPSYIMNGGLEGANVVTVALTGRVPCRVTGTVRKGDLMVSNGDGTARAEENPSVGSVIGKALENFDGATGTIEVVVGRV